MSTVSSTSKPVVWITGASSGIGKAFAKKYALHGSDLILSSRRKEELEKVKDELIEISPRSEILILSLDLAKEEELADKAQEAWDWKKRIDVLLNNGGISQRSLFLESEMSTLRTLMEVNFFGSLALTRYVLPKMVEQGSGHVLVTSSVAGKFGTKFRSGYAASKHAIQGAFDSIRQEMYEYNIAVTLICPGPIKTAITQNSLTGDGKAFGKMGDLHTQAMDADEMVQKIWKKVVARKEEIVVSGFKERFALLLKRIAPSLLNKILQRTKVV